MAEEKKGEKRTEDLFMLDDIDDDITKMFKTVLIMNKMEKMLGGESNNGGPMQMIQMMMYIPMIQSMMESLKPKSKMERMMEKMQEAIMFAKMRKEFEAILTEDKPKKEENEHKVVLEVLDKMKDLVPRNDSTSQLIDYLRGLEMKMEQLRASGDTDSMQSFMEKMREFITFRKQLLDLLKEEYYEVAPVKTDKGPDLLKMLAILVSSLKDISKRTKRVRVPKEPTFKNVGKINIKPEEIAEDKPVVQPEEPKVEEPEKPEEVEEPKDEQEQPEEIEVEDKSEDMEEPEEVEEEPLEVKTSEFVEETLGGTDSGVEFYTKEPKVESEPAEPSILEQPEEQQEEIPEDLTDLKEIEDNIKEGQVDYNLKVDEEGTNIEVNVGGEEE